MLVAAGRIKASVRYALSGKGNRIGYVLEKVFVGEVQWALCFVVGDEMSHQWREFLICENIDKKNNKSNRKSKIEDYTGIKIH